MDTERLRRVLDRIDAANKQDPHRASTGPTSFPHEFVYALCLTEWVLRLAPNASEALRIAARGQHIRRWTIPRSSYEAGRTGYLKWRTDLKKFHAETVGGIMAEEGCSPAETARVQEIILKKNLKDPETQTVEDGLCLVFLETQFEELKSKTPEEKMKEIVRKTWAKMSPAGHAAALALPLSETDRALIASAIGA